MNADGQVRFNALVSSSDESDADDTGRPTSSSEEEGEIRRKRFKVDAPPAKPEVPKWSNPDPYSVLPPTETIGAPRKDIVQVIRKAKNDVPRSGMTQSAAQNDDFISFTFGDDLDNDKASTGQRDAMDDASSEASSVRPYTMSNATNANGTHAADSSAAPSLPQIRPARGEALHAQRSPPIDLTQSDDELPEQPPRRHRNREVPAIDLISGDVGPPKPPTGMVMPTDEELVQQYVGQRQQKKRKRDEQAKGRGDITEAWTANWTEATPWCTVDRSGTADIGLRFVKVTPSELKTATNAFHRLHEEITDFFDFVRPHQHEEAIRQDLIQRVQAAVRSMDLSARNVDIKCFGSFAAGLYLPTADMDLVAVSPGFMKGGPKTFCQTKKQLFRLMHHLTNSGIAQPGTATAIPSAKVPIVKFTERKTGIKVDISFENDSGLQANRTFREWKMNFPTMPVIVVLIKQLLAMRDLNEVFTGGLGGFSIICLVVSMLQLMPEDEWEEVSESDQPYGDLLLKFLDLYGNQFNTHETGITMNPPGFFDKIDNPVRSQNARTLTIIDPNNPSNDISGGSREIHAVFEVFRKAHSQILQRMSKVQAGKDVQDSILGCVLGGNYSSFIHQRNKLYKLYSGESVSPPPEPARSGQPPPQKRKRGKPGNQDPTAKQPRKYGNAQGQSQALPTGPLSARVQGGPPANQRYVDVHGAQSSSPSLAESAVQRSGPVVSMDGGADFFGDSLEPSLWQQARKRQAATFGDIQRAKNLRRKHLGLASVIPQNLSKAELKEFRKTHSIF